MKPGWMRDWLRPVLGAALLLGGAAGLASKVIRGYRHASPDAFFSVQDQNKLPAASPADQPAQAATIPVDAPAPQQTALTAAQTAATAAQPPITAAPPAAPGNSLGSASSAAASADLPAEAQDSPECAGIKSEQHEIRGALNKQYSPEEGRYLQRRLRELAEQLIKLKCPE
jgi:hypothetical protein